MKKQTESNIKAHLFRGACYLILLLAVCLIPFALAQRASIQRSAVATSHNSDSIPTAMPTLGHLSRHGDTTEHRHDGYARGYANEYDEHQCFHLDRFRWHAPRRSDDGRGAHHGCPSARDVHGDGHSLRQRWLEHDEDVHADVTTPPTCNPVSFAPAANLG